MTDERHEENGRTQVLAERIMKRLRGEERRGVSFASITVAVSALGALGGFGLLAMDVGAQKQRVDTIEKRQVEDRSKVDRIDAGVQEILQRLQRWEGAREAREIQERERREREERNRERREPRR